MGGRGRERHYENWNTTTTLTPCKYLTLNVIVHNARFNFIADLCADNKMGQVLSNMVQVILYLIMRSPVLQYGECCLY